MMLMKMCRGFQRGLVSSSQTHTCAVVGALKSLLMKGASYTRGRGDNGRRRFRGREDEAGVGLLDLLTAGRCVEVDAAPDVAVRSKYIWNINEKRSSSAGGAALLTTTEPEEI